MQKTLSNADVDGDGLISYTEFLNAMTTTSNLLKKEILTKVFEELDTDHSGGIDMKEMSFLFLGKNSKVMKAVDLDKNGTISVKEFVEAMTKGG